MREQILKRSIERLTGEQVVEAAWLWRSHYLLVPVAAVLAGAVAVAAYWVGFSVAPAVAIASAAVAVFATASTDHRILAVTTGGTRWLRGSQIRKVAKESLDLPGSGGPPELKANRFVLTEWDFAGSRWSVPKSSEKAMISICAIW